MIAGNGNTLSIVHGSLGAGVVLFAAVLFGFIGPLETVADSPLRWVWLGLAVVVVLAAGAIRARLQGREVEPGRRQALAVLLWALAETQALVGLVFYLITADVVPAAVGVLLFFFLWWRYRPAALPGLS